MATAAGTLGLGSRLRTGVAERWRGAPTRIEALFEAERDQLPLWLPVGLGAGIAAWFALPDPAAWTGFLLLCLALAIGALALASGSRAGRAVAVFALAGAIGCGLIWWKAERVARTADRARAVGRVQRHDRSRTEAAGPRGGAAAGPPCRGPELAAPAQDQCRREGCHAALQPGAAVRLRAWLMPPAPAAVPGAFDFSRMAWFQGIGGTGRALGKIEVTAQAGEQDWRARLSATRQRLADHVRERLGGGEGAVAAALATGDQGAISDTDAEAMRASGLAHLLSVSGLHLTAAVGAVMLLTLKLLALSPALALRAPLVLIAAGAGALSGVGYTLLTGAEVPTVRACIAALLVLGGIALGRDALTLRLVAVGALVVLLFWPESLAGASFQLSFAAITALVALHEHPRIKALLSRREEGLPAARRPRASRPRPHRPGDRGGADADRHVPLPQSRLLRRARQRDRNPAHHLRDHATRGAGSPVRRRRPGRAILVGGRPRPQAAARPRSHGRERARRVATLPSMPPSAFALMVAGGLWLALWRTGWRRWGLLPIAIGAALALATPGP
jgi:competence protein ComEC